MDLQMSRTPNVDHLTNAKSERAFQELEQLFIKQLLTELRKTVPENSMFGSSPERRHFEDMFDDAIATEMSKSGQFGIASQMAEQLRIRELKQEVAPKLEPLKEEISSPIKDQ